MASPTRTASAQIIDLSSYRMKMRPASACGADVAWAPPQMFALVWMPVYFFWSIASF